MTGIAQALTAALCVVLSVVVVAMATWRNVHWGGVLYFDVACPLSLLQTLIRTVVLVSSYAAREWARAPLEFALTRPSTDAALAGTRA